MHIQPFVMRNSVNLGDAKVLFHMHLQIALQKDCALHFQERRAFDWISFLRINKNETLLLEFRHQFACIVKYGIEARPRILLKGKSHAISL